MPVGNNERCGDKLGNARKFDYMYVFLIRYNRSFILRANYFQLLAYIRFCCN